jgi:Tol biopolymer transport system component
MKADGSGLRRLTDLPSEDSFPSWSPDGTRIAFRSDRGGSYDIYVMNTDGSGVTRLTDDPAGDGFPVWQPAPPTPAKTPATSYP